ncbi:MAG: hypothetical protein F8N15_01245 [Methanobacterium sp.]|nr:hypothetical protein [Methanobacterium sp.]
MMQFTFVFDAANLGAAVRGLQTASQEHARHTEEDVRAEIVERAIRLFEKKFGGRGPVAAMDVNQGVLQVPIWKGIACVFSAQSESTGGYKVDREVAVSLEPNDEIGVDYWHYFE